MSEALDQMIYHSMKAAVERESILHVMQRSSRRPV